MRTLMIMLTVIITLQFQVQDIHAKSNKGKTYTITVKKDKDIVNAVKMVDKRAKAGKAFKIKIKGKKNKAIKMITKIESQLQDYNGNGVILYVEMSKYKKGYITFDVDKYECNKYIYWNKVVDKIESETKEDYVNGCNKVITSNEKNIEKAKAYANELQNRLEKEKAEKIEEMKQTNDELYQLYLIKQVGESPYNFVYDEDGKIIGRIVYLDGEEVIQEWNEDLEEEAEEKRKKVIEEKEKKEEEEKRQKEEYEKRMKELEEQRKEEELAKALTTKTEEEIKYMTETMGMVLKDGYYQKETDNSELGTQLWVDDRDSTKPLYGHTIVYLNTMDNYIKSFKKNKLKYSLATGEKKFSDFSDFEKVSYISSYGVYSCQYGKKRHVGMFYWGACGHDEAHGVKRPKNRGDLLTGDKYGVCSDFAASECEFFNNLNIYTTTASGTAVSGEWKGSGHAWAEIYMDSPNGTGWFKFDYHLTSKKPNADVKSVGGLGIYNHKAPSKKVLTQIFIY